MPALLSYRESPTVALPVVTWRCVVTRRDGSGFSARLTAGDIRMYEAWGRVVEKVERIAASR